MSREVFNKIVAAATKEVPGGVSVDIASLTEAFVYIAKAGGRTKKETLDVIDDLWDKMKVTVTIPNRH